MELAERRTVQLAGQTRSRTAAAWAALLGRSPRRWTFAVYGALAGAAAGAGAAFLVRRWIGQDAPDAVEPHQLRAVVDSGPVA
jgi:hypothetical protein